MPLHDAERAMVADAIAHFEALQKRYTRQHNGTACEHVKWALEGLNRLTEQPDCMTCRWALCDADDSPCDQCISTRKRPLSNQFRESNAVKRARMSGERAGKERDDGGVD